MTTDREREYEKKYFELIESIDGSQAGTDDYGGLAWHIDCSAMANSEGSWEKAHDTAVMIFDCWQDFYPELVKEI